MSAPNHNNNQDVLDFHSQFVSFIPIDDQARWLVAHQLSNGVDWGRLYGEAARKAFLADHGTDEERWYNAILAEMRWRVIGACLAGIQR